MPSTKSLGYLLGYSTSSLRSIESNISSLDSFFNTRGSEHFVIFGEYDLISLCPLDYDFDLLSRKFSKFHIAKQIESDKEQENFLTYSNWINLVSDNGNTCINKLIFGLIRIQFSSAINSTEIERLINEVNSFENFKDDRIRIFRSYSWDDVQIIINTDSLEKVFRFTHEINNIQINNLHLNETETLVGFKIDLYKNEFSDSSDLLCDSDNIAFSIESVGNSSTEIEKQLFDEFSESFDAYRVLGKVDYFIYPKVSEFKYFLSTKEILKFQINFFKFISKLNLKITLESKVYSELIRSNNNSSVKLIDRDDKIFNQSLLEHFYNALKLFKVPTPERSSIIFLINNFNRYVEDPLISKRIIDLYIPIKTFINEVIELKDEQFDNYSPIEISSRLKDFTKALEQAIENILHSSPRFERINDIFITTKCSLSKVLWAYNDMCKKLTEGLGIRGFFVHFDYDCHLKISDQSLNLNLYNLIKPELFCSLIGAEIFNLYLQQVHKDLIPYKNFLRFSELRNRNKSLEAFMLAIEGDFLMKFKIFKYNRKSPMKMINKYFVDHIYMDIFNFYYLFSGNSKLYSFWYWAVFLMDPLKYNSVKQIDNLNLQTRMLRFEIVGNIINEISQSNKTDKKNLLYPISFTDELPWNQNIEEINVYTETILKCKEIKKWVKETILVFDHINKTVQWEKGKLVSYRIEIIRLLQEIYSAYNKSLFNFNSSGALVLNKDISLDSIREINLIRSNFLEKIISINEKRITS